MQRRPFCHLARLTLTIMIGACWVLLGSAQAQTQPHTYSTTFSTTFPTTGTVTRVSDGDTLWVRLDDTSPGGSTQSHARAKPLKLRLQGIDAPERCQAWGAQAQAALAARVLNQRVQVQTRAKDDYGRSLGNVFLAGDDISAWLVSEGHAWSYRYRQSNGPYAAQEQVARQARKGLFSDASAMEPRQFRKTHGPCA